ncbi:hypothetical protein PPL_08021 [Heterostelium album PN500]|uniref:Uncharacterized protein n=1 Tax=Heterostelium pallidum (strain ATCC 26659 / Pp 5 / PN500) TaxID=670386 RepID=D3BHL8_HETP5|nr:hypothetical protein PPL_08021 [Heterostelium album PN500]EFA79195.1 hypothetical protein PPL_08021 [Heterostelium album PN500]|eukprot:XP_020431316.1 hypothetical protein PPL_08021 [Heterostelium album PN500]
MSGRKQNQNTNEPEPWSNRDIINSFGSFNNFMHSYGIKDYGEAKDLQRELQKQTRGSQ